jgi:hypothetical protein
MDYIDCYAVVEPRKNIEKELTHSHFKTGCTKRLASLHINYLTRKAAV